MESKYVRMCANVVDRHVDDIRSLHQQTGLGMSEIVRRIFDYSLQSESLNRIVPTMSGQLYVGGKH